MKISCALVKLIFLYTVYQFLPNLVTNDVSAGKKLQSTDDDE